MYKYIKMISIPLFFDSRKGQGKSEEFTTSFNPTLQLDISKSYEIVLILKYGMLGITLQMKITDFFTHQMVQFQDYYEYHQAVIRLKT